MSSLVSEQIIMNSDEDQDIVEYVVAGFGDHLNFIVLLDHSDYGAPERSYTITATVNKEDAYYLAQMLEVPLAELPDTISKSMERYRGIKKASHNDVRACFKEITDSLHHVGCRCRIHRQGWMGN